MWALDTHHLVRGQISQAKQEDIDACRLHLRVQQRGIAKKSRRLAFRDELKARKDPTLARARSSEVQLVPGWRRKLFERGELRLIERLCIWVDELRIFYIEAKAAT